MTPFLAQSIFPSVPGNAIMSLGVLLVVALVPLSVTLLRRSESRRAQRATQQLGLDQGALTNQPPDWQPAENVLSQTLSEPPAVAGAPVVAAAAMESATASGGRRADAAGRDRNYTPEILTPIR